MRVEAMKERIEEMSPETLRIEYPFFYVRPFHSGSEEKGEAR